MRNRVRVTLAIVLAVSPLPATARSPAFGGALAERWCMGCHVIEREPRWTPGSRMTISMPADVTWRPAEKPRAILRGPAWLLEHVHLDNDQLRGRFKWRLFHDNRIQLELQGPSIESWRMRGSGEYARTLETIFDATVRRLGFPGFPAQKQGTFRRPTDHGQLRLVDR